MASDVQPQRLHVLHRIGDMTRHIREYLTFACSSDTHTHGIYYFGIVGAACYLESVLEEYSYHWCNHQPSGKQALTQRLLEAISKDVSRTTGLDSWKKWVRVLYDVDLVKALGDDWPKLDILFQFRNHLAHGRTTKLSMLYNDAGKFVGVDLEGCVYQNVFTHLLDKKVLVVAPGSVPTQEALLSGPVVRYFVEIVERAIVALKSYPDLATLTRES